jgi:hypothetical protein
MLTSKCYKILPDCQLVVYSKILALLWQGVVTSECAKMCRAKEAEQN